jgi:hypothetical protein
MLAVKDYACACYTVTSTIGVGLSVRFHPAKSVCNRIGFNNSEKARARNRFLEIGDLR